jgi:hypothetical protein
MASPGDNLRKVWTADFYNRLVQLLSANGPSITVSGRGFASNGRKGSSIVIKDPQQPLSTIQGILTGGAAPAVTDGTVIVDPRSWGGYSVQAAYFRCTTGSTNVTVLVGGTPVSWLNAIAVTGVGQTIFIPNPVPDVTHVIAAGQSLSIQLAGSSSDCTGFTFSLNCPF